MKGRPHPVVRGGFTLVELVTAAAVVSVAMGIMLSAYIASFRAVGGNSLHIHYIDQARAVEQRLINIIQCRAAVGASTNGLNIFSIEGTEFLHAFTLRFEDGDGDPATLTDNRLLLDPDLEAAGDETVVCRMVNPLGTNAMFQMSATRRGTAEILFQIGELAPGAEGVRHGRGYHGVEVRIAATPRNTNLFMQ